MEVSSLSSYDLCKRGLIEGQRYEQEIAVANKELDYLVKHSKKVTYLEGNHECLDEQTELLTERGWITYDKINSKDKVLSLSQKGRYGEWVGIDRILINNFRGSLNHIKTSSLDLKATDNHKLFYVTPKKSDFKFSKLGCISGTRYNIPVNCYVPKQPYDISDNWIKLIAWILTDGCISGNRITIYQRKSKMFMPENVVKNLGLNYKLTYRNRDIKEICGKKLKSCEPQGVLTFSSEVSKGILKYIEKDKSIPQWAGLLDKRQFTIFLSSLIDGDGSRHKSAPKTSWMLYGKKEFLEKIQILCLQSEYCANLAQYRDNDFRLNINPRKFYHYEGGKFLTKTPYDGVVWDLTVKNHNFMIRRGGRCHFTGNSRTERYLEDHPELKGILELPKRLDLARKGIKWHKINELIKRGKLYFTHGVYYGKYFAKKTVEEYGCSIVVGHAHRHQVHTIYPKMQKHPMICYALGCLGDTDPSYKKNAPTGHINQFAVCEIGKKGYFNLYPITIIDKSFRYGGKEWTL